MIITGERILRGRREISIFDADVGGEKWRDCLFRKFMIWSFLTLVVILCWRCGRILYCIVCCETLSACGDLPLSSWDPTPYLDLHMRAGWSLHGCGSVDWYVDLGISLHDNHQKQSSSQYNIYQTHFDLLVVRTLQSYPSWSVDIILQSVGKHQANSDASIYKSIRIWSPVWAWHDARQSARRQMDFPIPHHWLRITEHIPIIRQTRSSSKMKTK